MGATNSRRVIIKGGLSGGGIGGEQGFKEGKRMLSLAFGGQQQAGQYAVGVRALI